MKRTRYHITTSQFLGLEDDLGSLSSFDSCWSCTEFITVNVDLSVHYFLCCPWFMLFDMFGPLDCTSLIFNSISFLYPKSREENFEFLSYLKAMDL